MLSPNSYEECELPRLRPTLLLSTQPQWDFQDVFPWKVVIRPLQKQGWDPAIASSRLHTLCSTVFLQLYFNANGRLGLARAHFFDRSSVLLNFTMRNITQLPSIPLTLTHYTVQTTLLLILGLISSSYADLHLSIC